MKKPGEMKLARERHIKQQKTFDLFKRLRAGEKVWLTLPHPHEEGQWRFCVQGIQQEIIPDNQWILLRRNRDLYVVLDSEEKDGYYSHKDLRISQSQCERIGIVCSMSKR